jgi:NAD(P)-dependent dehydrogenase (short-subunit alcohol dehydrogenase family)
MGYVWGIQYAVPYMKKNPLTNVIHRDEQDTDRRINAGSRGSIINISSVCGFMAVHEFLPYNISKAVRFCYVEYL